MLYVKESSAGPIDLSAQGGGHRAIRLLAMKILLTGGSGFLGSYVAEQLASAGHGVRALVRPRSDKRLLERLPGVEFAHGAIEDRASLDPAVAGVDAVIHVA
ncbi:MAG TPA: NAD-dependent epimerase/dehydratase family protein, partial [Myxococcales bacterium]